MNLTTENDIKTIIRKIQFNNSDSAPKWFDEIKLYDDQHHLDMIKKYENEITQLENKIDNSKKILDKNNVYKSILYTQGTVLVKVVFEMLETMLNCDLSDFCDVYHEDVFIEFDDWALIGEIKGVKSNVKNSHLSQLDNHADEKIETNNYNHLTLKQILIINTFREQNPYERIEVENKTIKKAKKIKL